MQYSTPQFIEKEGKIVFFLTFRQFFWLIGGGVICFFLYFIMPFYLFAILSIMVVILVAVIAFLKIDNVPVLKILLNYIGFLTKAKIYTWKKKESVYPSKIKSRPMFSGIDEPLGQVMQNSKLKEIKKMIETKK